MILACHSLGRWWPAVALLGLLNAGSSTVAQMSWNDGDKSNPSAMGRPVVMFTGGLGDFFDIKKNPLTNGDIDPTNPNNKTGYYIPTPNLRVPRDSDSGLTVNAPPYIDSNGTVWAGTGRSDYSPSRVGRAEVDYDAQGQAWFWSPYRDAYGSPGRQRAPSSYDRPTPPPPGVGQSSFPPGPSAPPSNPFQPAYPNQYNVVLRNDTGLVINVAAKFQDPASGQWLDRWTMDLQPGQTYTAGYTQNSNVYLFSQAFNPQRQVIYEVSGNEATLRAPFGTHGMRKASYTVQGNSLLFALSR